MGTLSEIQHWEQIDSPFVVEKIEIPDYEMEDLLEPSSGWYFSGQGVYRTLHYENNQRCPDLVKKLIDRYQMDSISAFSSIDESSRNGFDRHVDNYEICALNLIGNTIWHFPDESIPLSVGEVLYIPKNLPHWVTVVSEERFSVSLIR